MGILAGELDVPLIGFAGGPFTVASYLVEGGPSKNFTKVKALMHGEPAIWHELIERLTDLALASLRSQLDAGASAVQVFDSWAGILTPHHYRELVLPATPRLFAELADSHPGVPTILFGVGTGELLASMATAGSSVVGVDWRVPLDEARRRVGPGVAVQGNLDPAMCLASWEVAAAETREVLAGPRQPRPATSSTSATASCPRPTRASSSRWWSWSTPRAGPASGAPDDRTARGTDRGAGHGPRDAVGLPRASSPSTPRSGGAGPPRPSCWPSWSAGTRPSAGPRRWPSGPRPGGGTGRGPRRVAPGGYVVRYGAKHAPPPSRRGWPSWSTPGSTGWWPSCSPPTSRHSDQASTSGGPSEAAAPGPPPR